MSQAPLPPRRLLRPLGWCALALALTLLLAACGGKERRVKAGDTVSVNYTGTLDDGTVFDSSEGKTPLTFQVGKGQMIPGFDQAVLGMAVGETKQVHLTPDQAYGQRRPELVVTVPATGAPAGLKKGDQVRMGNGAPATVVEVTGDTITVDANNPLAGQNLNFKISIVSIN
jgi:peptidylprolyl isomerase